MVNSIIAQAKKRSQVGLKINDKYLGELTLTLKPMSPIDIANNYETFKKFPKDKKEKKLKSEEEMNDDEIKITRDVMIPLMKELLPACIVDPPVTSDDNDPRIATDDAFSIKDFSFGSITTIFQKISDISGLTEDAVETRKNLEKSP